MTFEFVIQDLEDFIEKSPSAEFHDIGRFSVLLNEYMESSKLEIILMSFYAMGKIQYHEYQVLAKWLSVYTYIIPAEREILPELSDFLYTRNRYNLFALALIVGNIQANMSMEKQHLLLEYLQTHQS